MSDEMPDVIYAKRAGSDAEWEILAWERNFGGAEKYHHGRTVQVLIDALKFYATKIYYNDFPRPSIPATTVELDTGDKAWAALKQAGIE